MDSRGSPTVGCEVALSNGGRGRVTVPSGASTGRHEAHERRDGDASRYDGRGVRQAVDNVRGELRSAVVGLDAEDHERLDRTLCEVDGTVSLERLGANAILAVSLAAVLAAADGRRVPLHRYLAHGEPVLPMPMINIISGGAHADGAIDIQDVLVVPIGARGFAEAVEWSQRVRTRTAELAVQRGMEASLVADEGGLGLPLATNEAALELVCAGIERAGLRPGEDAALAIDIAANALHDGDGYRLATEERRLTGAAWIDELTGWCERYPVVSLEDPLAEDEWPVWTELTGRLGRTVQILGDDLFATNQARLQRGIDERAANAVLLKPNQAGTFTRARDTWRAAADAGYGTVISARSGDTEDSWLADAAVAWSTGQIKVGSTTRSERTAKWNRLLQLEVELGDAAVLARPFTARGPLSSR